MEAVSEQLTTRDVALLTWLAVGLLTVAWSMLRGGDVGRGAAEVVRAFFNPHIYLMVLLLIAWQLVFVYLAARVGFWGPELMRDTVVILLVGGFTTGFKALALMKGEQTWRGEVRALVALVVVIQWISNLETFPYIVKLLLVPIAILLGGTQALVNLDDEYVSARPFFNGIVTVLGLSILVWSVYRMVSSWGSAEWTPRASSSLWLSGSPQRSCR